jgi:hypothetical protein
MLTSLQYKCVNKQTRWVRVRSLFKVRNFRTRTSEKSADSDSNVRKAPVEGVEVCLVFQNPHALGYPNSVRKNLCTNFWVNKSLSMMWVLKPKLKFIYRLHWLFRVGSFQLPRSIVMIRNPRSKKKKADIYDGQNSKGLQFLWPPPLLLPHTRL